MKKTFQLTEAGLSELIAELEELKSRRSEIADRIATARDFGDLRENSEYDAARSEQTMVETRIAEIEEIMQNTEVVTGGHHTVCIGSTVELERVDDKKKVTYSLVGSVEANPADGKISDESPLGQALLNRNPGEVVDVQTPRGVVQYKILSLE